MKKIKISKRYRLEEAVFNDNDLRPALCLIKIEGKQAIATDGHILIAAPIENPNGDYPNVLLNPDVWKDSVKKKSRDDVYEIEVDTKANETGLVYPNWKRVIPEGIEQTFEIGLDVGLLFRLSKALGDEKLILRFNPNDNIAGVLVRSYLEDGEKEQAEALIMPFKLNG